MRLFWLLLPYSTMCLSTSHAQLWAVSAEVRVLIVYAQDSDDHYPLPSTAMRDSIYSRITNFYETMSYGAHQITFKEATHNGGYFVSKQSVPY